MLGFLLIPLPPLELSPNWAPAVLSLPPPCRGRAEVVSARLNPSHSTIDVRGVYTLWFCLVTTKIWSDGH